MRHYFLPIIALLVAHAHAVELSDSATLDEVLIVATRPEQLSKVTGNDEERFNALERLQKWPVVAPQDEARIASAFNASLQANDSNIRNAGAWGLGRRGHSEAIPTIFELGEKDPNLIGCFFQLYAQGRQVEPPLELLRKGLHSKNPWLQRAVLGAITNCKAVALRPDVETILNSDAENSTRDEAASTLWLLRLSDSLPAFRRAFAGGLMSRNVVYGLTKFGGDTDIDVLLPLLQSENEDLRHAVAYGLSSANLTNPRQACDALYETLHDPSSSVRLAAVRALGHFRDTGAIGPIREMISDPRRPISWDDRDYTVRAIDEIGGAEAIALLNSMVHEFRDYFGLEQILVRLRSPSSARAIWAEYLKDPIRGNPAPHYGGQGYYAGVDVLAACSDAELLGAIQIRSNTTKDENEKLNLKALIGRIRTRFNQRLLNIATCLRE